MLFVPGEIMTREHGFDRIEPLRKHPANPVLRPDRPWESMGVEAPCVLYDEREQLFRMWYIASNTGPFARHSPWGPALDNWEVSGQWFLCYAQSHDGLTWEKPSLGLYHSARYPENNIVMADSGLFLNTTTVIQDAADPDPARRYKLLMYDNDGQGHDGARTAVSADGIHWQFVGPFPVLPSQDTPSLWHDRRNGLYVAFLKTRLDNRRARLVAVSQDFAHWSAPTVLLANDLGDAPTLHFYTQSAFEHCGHNLGFLGRLDQATQKLDVELITGPRGGADWRRLPTRPQVLAPGNPGEWDGYMIMPGVGEPLVRGDTCWTYYTGGCTQHDVDCPWAIGLATFTTGRIVGQQFEGEGWFTTAPFFCPGGRLTLDARANEPLTVAICGAAYGGELAGYRRGECQPVQGNGRDLAIRWAEHADLEAFRGQYITLRVSGRNAVVYGASFD